MIQHLYNSTWNWSFKDKFREKRAQRMSINIAIIWLQSSSQTRSEKRKLWWLACQSLPANQVNCETISVNTQKPAPATSVFIRDALEEHPWHALRRKTPNCTNSSNLSRQFLAEEFSSNPLRTRRSSTIFRYVREERETLNLGQINLGTTRASVSRLIKAMYTQTKLHPT